MAQKRCEFLFGDFVAVAGGHFHHQIDISFRELQIEFANQLFEFFLAHEVTAVGVDGCEDVFEMGELSRGAVYFGDVFAEVAKEVAFSHGFLAFGDPSDFILEDVALEVFVLIRGKRRSTFHFGKVVLHIFEVDDLFAPRAVGLEVVENLFEGVSEAVFARPLVTHPKLIMPIK